MQSKKYQKRNKDYKKILKKYKTELADLDFEILKTPKLGWIAIMTEYYFFGDPVRQFKTASKLEEFIVDRIELSKKIIE